MKIDMSREILQNADTDKIAYGNSHNVKDQARIAGDMGGFILDISGTVTDNAAYGMGELKSSEEFMQDAGQVDVALQRKYMAVMSNSMSEEDFAELQKEGFSVKNTTIEEQVTSLDKIKAQLAENGTVIKGYNDDLSDEELDNITGSASLSAIIKESLNEHDLPVNEDNVSGMSEAIDKASGLNNVTDDMKKYMLVNNLEPSIDNLYKAQYSAGSDNGRVAKGFYQDSAAGYYAKKADVLDWDSIKDQAAKVIERSGLDVDDTTNEEAKWIIEKGIPLTEKTISLLHEINELEFPLDNKSLADKIAIAYADGKSAENAVLSQEETIAEKAQNVLDCVNNIEEAAVADVVRSGKVLNIRNLTQAQLVSTYDRDAASMVSAMRFLEETRLQMTLEANRTLIKNGIDIDIMPLAELVDKLREAETQFYAPLLSGEDNAAGQNVLSLSDKIDLFKHTQDVFEALRSIPSEILGRMTDEAEEEFTANNLYNAGTVLKSTYDAAGKTYEALMTAPRSDMGDSIRKAFRNVDDILADNDFEITEINRKAVRILGYAEMDINPESIRRVRDAEMAVTRLIEKMTPAKTLEMIRDGENPLDENIYALADKLSDSDSSENTEKFSRFLLGLEKSNKINEQEKEAYLGIYRLFRQIEKSDGKVVGNVLNEGGELTLRNLLSAMRSNSSKGMDYKVDDNFGGLEGIRKNQSISDQIDGYYARLAGRALEDITPELLSNVGIDDSVNIEVLADKIINEEADSRESDYSLYKEDMSDLSMASEASDEVIGELISNSQEVTIDNILAEEKLMNSRGSFGKDIFDFIKGKSKENDIRKAINKLADDFTDEESAKKAFEEFKTETDIALNDAAEKSDKYIDVREMNMLHKELSLAAGNVRNENYEIPVEIDGTFTSINVKIIRDEENGGKVSATMNAGEFGNIAAEFRLDDKKVTGYITGDMRNGIDALMRLDKSIRADIEKNGRTIESLSYLDADKINLNAFGRDANDTGIKADTKDLYEIGKAVIKAVQKMTVQ